MKVGESRPAEYMGMLLDKALEKLGRSLEGSHQVVDRIW